MTDAERDDLLLQLRDSMARLENMQLEHVGKSLDELTPKVDALAGLPEKVDALSDQVQDLARAVRELGGDVDEPPAEATG